jgi:hypothetical protein
MENDMTGPRPPWLATRLVAAVLRADERDALLGDLCEEFVLRASGSPQAAARWYWNQAIRSVPVLLGSRSRRGRWISTLAIAAAAYVVVGALNALITLVVERWLGTSVSTSHVPAAMIGLSAIAGGAHLASRVRPLAGKVLGGLVMLVALLLLLFPVDASPVWYQLIFLFAGPLAAHLGSAVAVKMSSRALIASAIVLLGGTLHAQSAESTSRRDLLAAKTALYDSNFRNDRAGLRAAIGRAQAASADQSVRAMALYYTAWGEWALSHADLQAGDMESAQATLLRAERAAREGLALRPDDVEFVVMLADVLIWRLVADPKQFAGLAPEVRTLRTRALASRPENPRALIMDAGLIFNNPPERGGDRAKGLAIWKRAIALFEHEAATLPADPLRPDWGLALSYAWMCDLHLAMRPRQVDEARAAAQKALALRPDFWYVKEVIAPRLR